MGVRERISRFMYGRYGSDALNRFYLGISVLLLLAGMVIRSDLVYLAGLLILAYSVYRSLSKNVPKMYAQNQKFLTWWNRMSTKWKHQRERFSQRKVYRFYKCPGCKQRVRVPKGRGKIAITCPRCRMEFIKKS